MLIKLRNGRHCNVQQRPRRRRNNTTKAGAIYAALGLPFPFLFSAFSGIFSIFFFQTFILCVFFFVFFLNTPYNSYVHSSPRLSGSWLMSRGRIGGAEVIDEALLRSCFFLRRWEIRWPRFPVVRIACSIDRVVNRATWRPLLAFSWATAAAATASSRFCSWLINTSDRWPTIPPWHSQAPLTFNWLFGYP